MENYGISFSISYSENFISDKIAGNNGTSALTFYFNEKNNCSLWRDKERTDRPSAEMVSSYYELGYEGSGCIEMADGDDFPADKKKRRELEQIECFAAVHWRLHSGWNCLLHTLSTLPPD